MRSRIYGVLSVCIGVGMIGFIADGPDATLVELEHRKFEQMGAEAGASLRKDVDGGWPGMLEHFKKEAAASKPKVATRQASGSVPSGVNSASQSSNFPSSSRRALVARHSAGTGWARSFARRRDLKRSTIV